MIAVRKRTDPATAAPGDRLRYRITVRNRGARTAHPVRVCDRLPAGLTFVRRPGSRLIRGQACWTLSTLAPRAARPFRVTNRVLDGPNAHACQRRARPGRQSPRGCDTAAV